MNTSRIFLVGGLIVSLGFVGLSASARAAPASAPVLMAPAAEGAFITAIGVGISAPPVSRDVDLYPQTLFVSSQLTASAAEIQAGLTEMSTRVAAIRAALVRAGVADSAIHMQNLAVYPQFGPKPSDASQPQSGYSVTASMQVDVTTVRLLVAATEAAIAAGATQVGTAGKGGVGGPQSVQPAQADLDAATTVAVANARANAEAVAKASGKRLGAVHSMSALPPSADCCPPGAGWRVQVTMTFEYQ
jgi:uncharacterized protein YggE